MTNRITSEISSLIGKKYGPFKVFIESGAIEKFADAIGDENTEHQGQNAIASPTFPTTFRPKEPFPDFPQDYGDVGLHASQTYEYKRPIVAGDEIDVTMTISNIYQKDGKSGELVFMERDYSFMDSKTDEKIGSAKWVTLRRFNKWILKKIKRFQILQKNL